MTEPRGHGGPPWRRGSDRPGWPGPGFGPGRRFRRRAIVFLLLVALLVAALATVVGSVLSGNAPAPWITVLVSVVVVAGLAISVRWLWRNARAAGALMDAAERVAAGDYATRVPATDARQLGRLSEAFNLMMTQLATNERRRRELLADVAHELRTPLQVIRGTLEGMLDGLYPATEPARLQTLLDETNVMARLLEDLRTLSMAEAGALELHRETVDPRAIADDVRRRFRPIAESAGVTVSIQADAAPPTIEADPLRLDEVLTNLLTNALHHTPRGGRVTIEIDGSSDATTFVVRDTGAGIASDQLPFVFDRFVTSAAADGTGLGLAIAKRLVEAHGGTIEAVASATGGTAIRFAVPPARS